MLMCVLAAFVVAQPPDASPAGEVVAALADCLRLDEATAKQTRYLTMFNVPAKERPAFVQVLAVHLNGLSREAELKAPRLVTPTLLALCCDDYGWELTTYGSLHEKEPYFHVRIRIDKEEGTAHAPWLPTKEIAILSKMTNSLVPILRADWFLYTTSQPRVYYSFLGIKKLSDLEKLVGIDRETSVRVRKELAAIVADSAVTINPRTIIRLQGSAGSWWETRDNSAVGGDRNPLRVLDADYKFAAREIYATLSNGMFAMALASDKDDLIEFAPPDVANDSKSPTPDKRIRPPLCVNCHTGTLQPIDDYARRVFGGKNGIAIGVPADRTKAKRLSQLYLGPLFEELDEDKARYAKRLKAFVGSTPAEFANTFTAAYYAYESVVSIETVAAEFGISKETFVARLQAYIRIKGVSDLGLAPFVTNDSVRRSHVEEMWPVLAGIVYRIVP